MKQAALSLNLNLKKHASANSWSRWGASFTGLRWWRLSRRTTPGRAPGGCRLRWQAAMHPGRRWELDQANSPIDALVDKIDKLKAGSPTRVEHPLRVGQAPVWVREGALPGLEEKHTAAQNPVCAAKPVDGPAPVAGRTGMSASESRAAALNGVEQPALSASGTKTTQTCC